MLFDFCARIRGGWGALIRWHLRFHSRGYAVCRADVKTSVARKTVYRPDCQQQELGPTIGIGCILTSTGIALLWRLK
jgi:hypothetical protein